MESLTGSLSHIISQNAQCTQVWQAESRSHTIEAAGMARLASTGHSPVRKRLMSSIVPLRATPVPDAVAEQKNGLAKCRIVSVPIIMKLFVHKDSRSGAGDFSHPVGRVACSALAAGCGQLGSKCWQESCCLRTLRAHLGSLPGHMQ